MSYAEKMMELFRNPKHVGQIKDASGEGEVGNMKCGDILKVYIKVKKNKKRQEIIDEIKFETFGCVAALASSEALCRLIKGKTIEDAEKLTNKDIIEFIGEVPQVKIHCSVLGDQALKVAIKDYKKKQKKKQL